MVKLEDIVVFARIAERESFSAAAKELTMSKSAVSKHISRLESELSLKLLHRSTHKLFLTEAGKAYYDYCVRIIGEIEQARISASGLNREIKGTRKVLTTPGVGQGPARAGRCSRIARTRSRRPRCMACATSGISSRD